MSVSNNFHDRSQVVNFHQSNRPNSESDEARKTNREPSKPSKFDEDSKRKLDESTSSSESYNAILQYDVEKRGLVVVFNQENFPNESEERRGTMQDVKALGECFFDIDHFNVIWEQDLSKELVLEQIQSVATSKKYKDYSYVLICLLSHGDTDGRIKLSCGDYITNEEIWQTFYSEGSIWVDKPKLFIFQACKGVCHTYTDNSNQPNEEVLTDIGKTHKMVPKEADILVAYSTVEGNVSIRTPSGTWYIQNLCKIIKKYGKREDILDILTRVNYEVANNCKASASATPELKGKTIRQMPMFSSTLTKKFYFYSQANRT